MQPQNPTDHNSIQRPNPEGYLDLEARNTIDGLTYEATQYASQPANPETQDGFDALRATGAVVYDNAVNQNELNSTYSAATGHDTRQTPARVEANPDEALSRITQIGHGLARARHLKSAGGVVDLSAPSVASPASDRLADYGSKAA